jgi:predicted aspartyl protease
MTVAAAAFTSPADQSQGRKLEDYLRRLGYEPVGFKVTKRNETLIDGEIGAGKKLVFLVDTGSWGGTRLSKESAAGLKTLGELGVTLDDRLMGPLTNRNIVLIDKLMLGRAQFLNQPARMANLDMDFVRTTWDAVLGADFFFRNFCLINCGSQKVYVRSAERSEEQSRALSETLRRSGYAEAGLEAKPGLTAEVKINGRPVRFIVDTGASFSMLDESQLKPLGLSTVKQSTSHTGSLIPDEETGRTAGFGKVSVHNFHVCPVKRLDIGAKELKDAHLGVVNLKAWGLLKPGSPA